MSFQRCGPGRFVFPESISSIHTLIDWRQLDADENSAPAWKQKLTPPTTSDSRNRYTTVIDTCIHLSPIDTITGHIERGISPRATARRGRGGRGPGPGVPVRPAAVAGAPLWNAAPCRAGTRRPCRSTCARTRSGPPPATGTASATASVLEKKETMKIYFKKLRTASGTVMDLGSFRSMAAPRSRHP